MTKMLYDGKLFWPTTLPYFRTYRPLIQDTDTTVAIVGGGMSGCICAYMFAQAGIKTVLLEHEEIASGSTSANTGLLQFCSDTMLSELIEQIGTNDAVAFYRACQQALEQLQSIATKLGKDVGMQSRSSLYFASTVNDLAKLQAEFAMLQNYGFPVEWWDEQKISEHFPFRKPGAIVTHGDAEVNPFQFVHALADAAYNAGVAIFEHTVVANHETTEDGQHILYTASGKKVRAAHVVYAIGYEPEQLRGQLLKASLNRSYAMVTNRQHNLSAWHERWLIWETARPYLYMRTTPDQRIVIGGLDEAQANPDIDEYKLNDMANQLVEQFHSFFPHHSIRAQYKWCATFGESNDGLPFIGRDPSSATTYYCLGYGGNGTVYSMLGATMLMNMINNEQHPLEHIVRLQRFS